MNVQQLQLKWLSHNNSLSHWATLCGELWMSSKWLDCKYNTESVSEQGVSMRKKIKKLKIITRFDIVRYFSKKNVENIKFSYIFFSLIRPA
jgi:hypothetical protein